MRERCRRQRLLDEPEGDPAPGRGGADGTAHYIRSTFLHN